MRITVWHSALAFLTATAVSASGQAPGAKPYTERVDVHRVLLDVRVTDGLGQPLEDLRKTDFVVRIDGKPAPVESAAWVTGALRSEGLIATPDGPPVIGATRYGNLHLNTGHGTLGWTMACGSGRVLADLMSGRKPDIDVSELTVSRYDHRFG